MPETAKLVVLPGPNGCGKNSLFDAFKTWHLRKGYSNAANNDYCKKISTAHRCNYDLVNIDFHTDISQFSQTKFHETFNSRTAYRNLPNISITSFNKLNSPLETVDNQMLSQNDAR